MLNMVFDLNFKQNHQDNLDWGTNSHVNEQFVQIKFKYMYLCQNSLLLWEKMLCLQISLPESTTLLKEERLFFSIKMSELLTSHSYPS